MAMIVPRDCCPARTLLSLCTSGTFVISVAGHGGDPMAAAIYCTLNGRPVRRRRTLPIALIAWLGAVANTADAAPAAAIGAPDPRHGEVLYLRHCVACHGGRAWGDGPREIPALAGQREAYLIEQLTRFASNERPGSAMHGPAMHDTLTASDVNRPVAIRDLAAYLARAPAAAQVEQGQGRSLALGKSAYLRVCVSCHGEDGAGADGGSARIGG